MGRIHIPAVAGWCNNAGAGWINAPNIIDRAISTDTPHNVNNPNTYWAIDLGKLYKIKNIQAIFTRYNSSTPGIQGSVSSYITADPAIANSNSTIIPEIYVSTSQGQIFYKIFNIEQTIRWIFYYLGAGDVAVGCNELSAYIDTSLITSPFKIYDGASEINLIANPVALGNTYLNYPEPSPLTSAEKFNVGIGNITKQGLIGTPKLFKIKNDGIDYDIQNVVASVKENTGDNSSDELMTISADNITYGKTINYAGILHKNEVDFLNLYVKTNGTTSAIGNHYNNINIEGEQIIP